MPRYFFNIKDGLDIEDEVGTELPDMEAVRAYALRTSGDVLKNGGNADVWNGHDWRMIVTDEAGREVIVTRFSAEQMAA